MNFSKAKRISVIGNSGAGKSTLSKKLGKSLGLEVYSVDKIYWLPGWELRGQNSFSRLHEQWLKRDSWIIDGVGYWSEFTCRLSISDIIVFLDLPVDLCKERAGMRIIDERFSTNPDITSGCVYGNVKDRQMEVIESFHCDLRPKILNYLSSLDQNKLKIISDYSELNVDGDT